MVTLVAGDRDNAALDATAAALGIQVRPSRGRGRATRPLTGSSPPAQVPLARLERGALLAPDGTRVTLPPPPPRFVATSKKGGGALSAALAGGDGDDDVTGDASDDERGDATPPRGRKVHKSRDAPLRGRK